MSDAIKESQQRPVSAPPGPRPVPPPAPPAAARPKQVRVNDTAGGAAAYKSGDPVPAAAQQWALWQMMDSAFPTGSFAHSNGLEASVQAGLVSPGDAAAVRRFAAAAVHSACTLLLPYAAAAHAISFGLRPQVTAGACTGVWGVASTSEDPSAVDRAEAEAQRGIASLCAQLDAQLAGNHVARRASAATGAALLRAAGAAFPAAVDVSAAIEAVQSSAAPHFAVAFGCVYGALGVPWPTAARAFAFGTVRDTVSAATRLNVVGPMVRGKTENQR